TFWDGAVNTGTNLGTKTLSGGMASLSISTLSVGSHSINASFTPSIGNYNGGNSIGSAGQTVNKSNTTTAVPPLSRSSTYARNVTSTATVAASGLGGGTPTGQVTFWDGPVNGMGNLGTKTLSGGTASLTINTLTASGSPHSINVSYAGDGNFNTSNTT